MGSFGKSVLLTLLALCFFTSSVFALGVNQPGADPLQFRPPPIKPPPLPPIIKPPPIKIPPLPPVLKPPPLPPVIKPPPMKVPPLLPVIKPPPIKVPTLPPVIKPPPLPPVIKPPPIKTPPLPPVIQPPPIKIPPLPPIKPPTLPLAVWGKVLCKACKDARVNPLLVRAKPIKDATVRLLCNNMKKPLETTTDKKGYFKFLVPKTVTNSNIKYCKAYLVKSPDAKCSEVPNLRVGKPKPAKSTVIIDKLKYALFNVVPFALDPTTCPK